MFLKLACGTISFLSLIVVSLCACSVLEPLVDSEPDENFSASIGSDDDHAPHLAKLSSDDAWCSEVISDVNSSPYIQVTFDSPVEIHAVEVGGHHAVSFFIWYDEYISSYRLKYKPIGGSEQFVIGDDGTPQIFGRKDNIELQRVNLNTSIITDLLQVIATPASWTTDYDSRVCIRFEAYGCTANILSSVTTVTSGTTTDSAGTFSSSVATLQSLMTPFVASSSIVSVVSESAVFQTVVTDHEVITSHSIVQSSIQVATIINPVADSASTSTNAGTDITSTSIVLRASTSTSSDVLLPVASNTSLQAAIVFGSASAGIFVFCLIVMILVVALVLCFVVRQSQRKKEHQIDNHLYGFSLDDMTSPADHKHDQLNGDDKDFYKGNIYDTVNVDEHELSRQQMIMTVTNDDDVKKKELLGEECMHLHANGSKLMPDASENETEKYDYVDRSDIAKLQLPPASTMSNEQESPNHEETETQILMSPNPLYNHSKSHQSFIKDDTHSTSPPSYSEVTEDSVPNPLYSEPVEDPVTNPLYSEAKEDFVPNPLYGKFEATEDLISNPLYGETDNHSKEFTKQATLLNDEDMVDNPLYQTS